MDPRAAGRQFRHPHIALCPRHHCGNSNIRWDAIGRNLPENFFSHLMTQTTSTNTEPCFCTQVFSQQLIPQHCNLSVTQLVRPRGCFPFECGRVPGVSSRVGFSAAGTGRAAQRHTTGSILRQHTSLHVCTPGSANDASAICQM